MRFKTFFDKVPAGVFARAHSKDETTADVISMEFTSSEDGSKFLSRLEGFPTEFLARAPSPILPSTVSNIVAVIHPDGNAEVAVNETNFSMLIRPRRKPEVGANVFRDDITSIRRVEVEGFEIPETAGVLVLFSIGWRKGLFFDYTPIVGAERLPRQYDLGVYLGQCFSYVMFQEMFKVSETAWSQMLNQRWFPFIYLGVDLIKAMVAHAENGWAIDDLLPKIAEAVRNLLTSPTTEWLSSPVLAPHLKLVETARERYLAGDFISATSILYPRIEGIMRSCMAVADLRTKPTPSNLAAHVTSREASGPWCVLLPDRFRAFLEEVYFANFDPRNEELAVGRHTVAHGVASAHDFSLKSATLGFLVLLQLSGFLPSSE